MIKIQKYSEVEADFFKGRAFGDSNEVVSSILTEVRNRGDAALRLYGNKYDVSVPANFEVSQEDLKKAEGVLKAVFMDIFNDEEEDDNDI